MTQSCRHWCCRHGFSALALVVAAMVLLLPSSAWAGRLDNAYDGNIFSLYAGDGAMVPPAAAPPSWPFIWTTAATANALPPPSPGSTESSGPWRT
ncbi:MAG: hypothetical protein F4Y10_01720 [Synechococcus sp. SB0663_bin_10]|nr:hypothetical protein [Synechococcus sp. SB0663_bin_10]